MADPTETGDITGAEGAPATAEGGLDAPASTDISSESQPAVTSEGAIGADSTGTPAADAEPTFFDASTLDPSLMPGYKQMQRAFTQKMQAIAGDRQKIDAYNAAIQDPRGTIEALARQAGIPVNFGGTTDGQPSGPGNGEEWNPQTWDEVIQRARTEAREEIMRDIQPFIAQTRKSQLERDLDDLFPTWREHEEAFSQTLMDHPTLANNASLLVQAATPSEILQAQATQRAIKQLEARAQGNKSKPGSPLRQPSTPKKPRTFHESWEAAMRAQRGE